MSADDVNSSDANSSSSSASDCASSMPSPPLTDHSLPSKSAESASTTDIKSKDCSSKPSTFRRQIGIRLSTISDAINDNLIIVRYATVSSVLLLGVYGVVNTPLFYRYKSIMDIPTKMFIKRKWIHGRIVGVLENGRTIGGSLSGQSSRGSNWSATQSDASRQGGIASLLSPSLQRNKPTDDANKRNNTADPDDIEATQQPIIVLFRHSSPLERLLTQSAMDKVVSFTGNSSSRLLYSSSNPHRNLLPIEVAGIASPPISSSSMLSTSLTGTSTGEYPVLNELIEQKTKVSLQLLAQRTIGDDSTSKHPEEGKNLPSDGSIENTAICHVHYRKPKQWFATTNAALEMVQKGQACASGVVIPLSNVDDNDTKASNRSKENTKIIDYDPTIKQLQNDTQYISQLDEAEYTAWKSKLGVWSSKQMRELRTDYVEESEKEQSRWLVWNMLKRGWYWIRR